MAQTKAFNNPTANPFELLHVDEEPEKRPRNTKPKPQQPQGGQQQAPASVVMETPAQKSERRAKAKQEKDRQADVLKKQQEQEKVLAALMPEEGFQVQKGSQSKKPVDGEKKKPLMNREEYEKNPEKPKYPKNQAGGKPYGQRDGAPRDGPIKKEFGTEKPKRNPQGDNPNRAPKHEGFDKQSGQRTTKQHTSKKDTADWGNAVQDWNHGNVTESSPNAPGWGGDEPSSAAQTPLSTEGWGGDDKKSHPVTPGEDGTDGKPVENAPPAKQRPPAWDEIEGHGKMLFDEFQSSVAKERHQALSALAPAKQKRQVEGAVDTSKFLEREKVGALGKVGGVETKKPEQPQKKAPQQSQKVAPQQPAAKPAPAKPADKQVELNAFFDVRQRGGPSAGRGRGGPAASRDRGNSDRPQSDNNDKPAPTSSGPQSGQGSPKPDYKPKPQGPRAGYPGGSNKVPRGQNAFPELAKPETKAQAPAAAPVASK